MYLFSVNSIMKNELCDIYIRNMMGIKYFNKFKFSFTQHLFNFSHIAI